MTARWTAGLLVMLAFLTAAGVTIWGTFETLTTYKIGFGPNSAGGARESTSSSTWWEYTGSSTARDWFPPYGLIPAIGAGLLVIAAILALTAFGGRRSGLITAIRVSASVGIGLLAGVVSIRLLDALSVLDQVNKHEISPGETEEFQIQLGIYLPAGAVAVGIIGLLLTLIGGRAGRVEPDTPRIGFPMPYQPYQQAYPGSQPFPAQPVPVPQPTSQPFPAQAAPQPAAPAPEPPDRPNATQAD